MQPLTEETARHHSDIKVTGNLAYLRLTKGQVAIIDVGDMERVQRYSWTAIPRQHGRGWQARRTGRASMMLHRFLMDATEEYIVAHRNGNGLDNRRENLRLCPVHREPREPSEAQEARLVMPTLKAAREQQQYSLKVLAHSAGVHWHTIWQAEHHYSRPVLAVRQRLAAALGYQADEINWEPAQPDDTCKF